MATQLAVSTRNAKLNAIEADVGISPSLQIRTGAPPANCAAVDTGVMLATMSLPLDWMSDAASGVKSKLGTWQTLSAAAAGTAGHYRIYDSSSVCKIQGTITATAGGGDMTLDDIAILLAQQVTITAYSWTESNG